MTTERNRILLLRPILVTAAALLAIVLLLRERSCGPSRGPEEIRDSEARAPLDADIQLAMREGRTDDAEPLLRSRLAEGPRSCVPYRLAIELAQRTGTLSRLVEDWERTFSESADPMIASAYGVAVSEGGDDERALSVFSVAVQKGSPCLDSYRRFVRASQRRGTLDDAERQLRQLDARRPNDPYVLHALAFLAEASGEGAAAKDAYVDAVSRPSPYPLPQSYSSLASLHARAGELEKALDVSREGAALARELGHAEIELDFLIQRADFLAWLGEGAESNETFEGALEAARSEHDRSAERNILLTRAALAAALGDPEAAADFFERAEGIPDPSPSIRARAEMELREGEVLITIGRLSEARARLEAAMRLAGEADAVFLEIDALLGLVQLAREEGSPTEALAMTEDALGRAIELRDGRRQAAALLAAATLYENMGRFDRAVQFLEQVLARARRDSDLTREVVALSNLSLVHLRLGRPVPAVRWAEEGRVRSRALRDRRVQLGVAQSLGAALAGAGRYEEAERVFRAAFAQSEELPDVELKGLIAAGLGRVLLARGNAEEAREVFERALAIALDARSRLAALQSRSGLGLALWHEGRLTEALDELESSLHDVETSRSALESGANRIRYAETRAQIYTNLTGVLIELDLAHPGAGYGERAFDVNERSRSRTLLDMVSRAKPEAPPRLLDRSPLSIGQIRARALGPGELLLQFALGEKGSTLWAMSESESRRYALPPRRVIEDGVRSFLHAIRTPPRASSRAFDAHLPHGRKLYSMLVAPAEELVKRAGHVIISPHGALNLLPFEALPYETDAANTPPSYLIERAVVSYAPSASALDRLRDRAAQGPKAPLEFFGIAQPSPGNPKDSEAGIYPVHPVHPVYPVYPPIPFAAFELESIAALFPIEERRIYVGGDASEEAVKEESLDRYRILHFAAHAEADMMAPERSAIVLGAIGESEDGLLHMAEVLDLDLASALVVLSACETGLGQVLEAEGTLGLSWAFLSAGSSAVAVSLWNVNDRSTATVMTTFYRALSDGQPPAASLADAKRAMLRSTRPAYRHPFYWAPFVLVGAG